MHVHRATLNPVCVCGRDANVAPWPARECPPCNTTDSSQPTQRGLKNTGAAVGCGAQFVEGGCENCPFLAMDGDRERAMDCTTVAFQGMITVIDPAASWAAKWLHVCERPRRPLLLMIQGFRILLCFSDSPCGAWVLSHNVCAPGPGQALHAWCKPSPIAQAEVLRLVQGGREHAVGCVPCLSACPSLVGV